MRNWIDLVESAGAIRVYHGGCGELSGEIATPFFTTTHYAMARSYAIVKGRGEGTITSFDLNRSAKIATVETLDRIASELGIDYDGSHPSDLLYKQYNHYDAIVQHLVKQKYQVVFMHDFGYHDDFQEEPTYIILDIKVLSNPEIVEKINHE